tara:strand:+ start:864 stop:1055 length:192 start_codon:yes stop_codon:yes gene_type:complete
LRLIFQGFLFISQNNLLLAAVLAAFAGALIVKKLMKKITTRFVQITIVVVIMIMTITIGTGVL